jgi:cytochrome b561
MPIVGAVAWLGLVEDAGDLHATAASILLPLIGLHVAGALAETFIFRNDTLKRMFVPDKTGREA